MSDFNDVLWTLNVARYYKDYHLDPDTWRGAQMTRVVLM